MPDQRPTLSNLHRRVTIKVTPEMIEAAQQRDSSHCMIAEAIKVAVPEARSVSVDLATMRFTDPARKQRYIYLTPGSAQQALIDFDQGNEVKPFTMHLKKAAQVLASGSLRKADGKLGKPSQKQQGVTDRKNESVPIRLGGTPPPNGALSTSRGRIRAYGLRQLKS